MTSGSSRTGAVRRTFMGIAAGKRRFYRIPRAGRGSAAAYRMHHFEPIAVADAVLGVPRPRHDLAVELDRDAALAVAARVEQRRDGHRSVELALDAVEHDPHRTCVGGSGVVGGAVRML